VTIVIRAIAGLSTGVVEMMLFELRRAMDRKLFRPIPPRALRIHDHCLGERRDENHHCRFARRVY